MSKLHKNPDIFGDAISDFHHKNNPENIIVHSSDFDDDEIPVDYLFRNFQEMPPLEKTALQSCRGKILDVGCGAGSHSRYLQQEKKLEVVPIDVSEKAIETCKLRGLKNARSQDFFKLENEKFDTILLLMNGVGIVGKLENLSRFFKKLAELLAPNGKVLLDSSDLSYLFEAEKDGGIWIDVSQGYYGEMTYRTSYKNQTSAAFDWLYLDFETLKFAAESHGFDCELVQQGAHYDYLAELKKM